jgi:hypothetical protein
MMMMLMMDLLLLGGTTGKHWGQLLRLGDDSKRAEAQDAAMTALPPKLPPNLMEFMLPLSAELRNTDTNLGQLPLLLPPLQAPDLRNAPDAPMPQCETPKNTIT